MTRSVINVKRDYWVSSGGAVTPALWVASRNSADWKSWRALAASSYSARRMEIVGFVGATEDPRAGPGGELSPQLTAFFTSAPIFASSAAVISFSAKEVGHMAPSSRFASSLKPNVAYLDWNFCALWKKQTTLPSLAYAGIPYQVFGERDGALALMIAWSRLAMARSDPCISAIFASRAFSPSALFASAFSSWARSFIAARSSSVNPLAFLLVAVVLLADFCVAFLVVRLPWLMRISLSVIGGLLLSQDKTRPNLLPIIRPLQVGDDNHLHLEYGFAKPFRPF